MLRRQSLRLKIEKINQWLKQPMFIPIILLVIAYACYGLLIDRLGYFWDDFPITYIKNVYGSAGLERYFSTNRPVWGYLYQLTFSFFSQPWHWQVNALVWRWLGGVLVWIIFRQVLPNQKSIALWVSMLFLVYPGFKQGHISVVYSNLFIVLAIFLLSIFLNIKALQNSSQGKPSWQVLSLHVLALILSLYHLLALEYFFVLDLLRPFLLWFTLVGDNYERKKRIQIACQHSLPYLVVWMVVVIWRVFFFKYQTQNYEILLLKSLQQSPILAIGNLIKDVAISFWVVLVNAWVQIFRLPDITQLGLRTFLVSAMMALAFSVILFWFLSAHQENTHSSDPKAAMGIGMIALILGGAPWWLIELPPTLRFPSDRFTLPFILGISLLIAGFVAILPIRAWMRNAILGILIGFAIASQFQVANQFRRDWEVQRRFFWQLAWRVPGLAPGTTLMVNDLPVTYFSDNSLTAPLNWFWARDNNTQNMNYLLYYPSQRLGKSLSSLNPGTTIKVDYLAAKFEGSTSQVVSIYYSPPACLRVLDPSLDNDNRMLSMNMQAAAALSSTEWIYPSDVNKTLPEQLYAPEPEHGWCYFYEKADQARQQKRWEEVASIGDQAYALNDYPNDPAEHFLYIEGYAHVENWIKAQELTQRSMSVIDTMKPLLCRLWQRIDSSTAESSDKKMTMSEIYTQLNCLP